MSDRDVRLNISATDTASGPLGRVKRSVDTLKDGLASFDASSLNGVERSFSKAAREIAKGTRDITKEIDVMSEAIEASEKNMAAAAGAMQRHASDIATAQKGAADARASADTMKNAVAAETARRKRLEEAQAEDLIRNKKALSDHVVEETRKIAADERKRIQVEIDRQNAIRGSLSSKRDEASVTQRAASKEQVKVLRRRLGYIGRLESLMEDKGLTWHSERRVKDFVGEQRLGEMKASFVPKATADYQAQIAEIDDRNAKAQNRIDALERVAAEKAKDAAALEKRMAQNRSTLDAEASRHGKLVEMRAKGRQMLADYQATAGAVTDARTEFGRQKDPVRVASAIDAASGANGEVTRTATANRRLASGAAEATEALKRQNAALAQNGNFLRDARNAVSGLVTLYMILTTVTDQAGKAVDAFRSRQAFDSKLNFVNDGDLQKTAASLDYVRGIAARYGLEIVDLQEKYSSFAVSADAVGVSTQKVETVFNGLSAAARVNKLNADQFGRAVNALTQSMSKNKVMSEELKSQLAEALPGAVGLFAKSMGYAEKDMAQFYKDLENGMFDAEAVVKFGAYLEKTFSGAADKAGDSFDAALNRFRNSLTYAREAFANSGLIDGLTDFMIKSREFLDSDEGKEFFAQAGEAAKSFLGIMGHLVANIDLIGKVLGGLVIAKFAKGLIGPLGTAFKVLNGGGRVAVAVARNIGSLSRVLRVLRVAFVGLTGPIGAVVTALSFALPWILDLFSGGSAKDSVAATKRADEVSNAIGEVSKAAVSAKGDVDALSKSLAEIGKGKIDAAMDAAKVSQGAAAGAIRSVRDDIVTRNEKGYVGRARQAINVANPSLASNRLLDQSLRDFYEGKLALDAKPGASAKGTADTLVKVLDDLRKASVITDDELNALKKEAQAYDLQRDALKKLGQAKAAASGDKSAAGELLNGMSAEIAEQNAKKIQQVDAALTSLEDKAKDATGIRDIKKSMLENAKAVEAATKKLEENRDALSPSEYASRADRIAKAYKAMGDDIAKSFFNATAAANGFDVTLGDLSSRQLQAMTASTTPESVANSGTSEREAYIREGLIKRGMPAHVADGFIANFKDESGLRPGAVEGAPNVHGTRGYGLYQLTDTKAGVGRRSQFEKFATDSGRKFDDMDAQMDFLVHELQTSERGAGEAILRSGSASEAAQLIVSKFLRPAKKHENARIAKYANLDATPAGSGPASVSSLSVWNPDVASQSDMRKSFSNAQGISTVLSGYGEKARDAVTAAVLKTPGLVSDTSLLLALQEKRIEDAAAIISQTDQSLADAFRENSAGTAAEETTRKAADKAKDLAEAAKKANEEIVDNVTKKLINDVRDEREKFAAETKAELDKQVRDEKLTPLDAEKLFASRLSVFDAERASRSGDVMSDSSRSMDDRLAAAGAMNDRAREELRLRGEIARATENGKTSLTEAQKQQYVLNGLTAYDAEQRRSAADAADAEVRGARDAAAVAVQRSEIDKIRLRTLQDIAEEERKTGVSLSQSQKDARVNANVDRYKAENPGWRVDEIAQANDMSVLDARASAIRAQMEAANGAGDLTKVETLKGQLAEINAELLRMIDLSISAMSGLSGPEAQKALADLQARRAEIAGTSDTVTRYGQAAQYWGVRAGETLSGGIGAFAKAVAESENPWKALAQTIAGSVGQIMIDIGEMIVKALIAQAVMKAMGIDQSGMPLPGASSTGPGGLLGSIIMGGFSAITGTGQYALPVHHEGGTVGQAGGAQRSLISALTGGLKGDERLAVLQIGEEVVTGKDARHRDNLGRSLGRIRRYHNGGVVDLSGGDSKVSGFAGLAASAVGAAAKAPDTVVNNLFDADDFINRTLGGRQGENMIANVISKNPKRFKTLMGGA